MTRHPLGAEIEAEHPPHGGHWERIAPGKLRLLAATYPQAETPAEAAHRAAQEAASASQAPPLAAPEAEDPPPPPRASRKKEG